MKRREIRPSQSGEFRHVGNIEKRVAGTDSTGAPSVTYVLWAQDVRFAIDDWKPYENQLAQAVERAVITRIRIRYRPGMSAADGQFRIVYQTNPGSSPAVFEYYDILGAVRDINLRVELQLTCSLRDAAGYRVGATP
ncbi:MAG TPA: head-tail adaptor protein [Steroidobacteraceae bacterium]